MNKTSKIMQRILQVENFQNVACYCANWQEFVEELAEWGVDGCAKIDFDDEDLDVTLLDRFIKSENGYERTGDDWNLIYNNGKALVNNFGGVFA
tara:strand:- start:19 stop:300 length:282 start_codon:yes stop_codon:yes gene_type:complete